MAPVRVPGGAFYEESIASSVDGEYDENDRLVASDVEHPDDQVFSSVLTVPAKPPVPSRNNTAGAMTKTPPTATASSAPTYYHWQRSSSTQ
ncbi:hypothetical protein NM688_g6529 [Phlebia brevispora]|uniref:Uncharacterized protein n=1 Tax=Phlebia brevispora TaxID=194682 RepID=A0ACC1SFB8_9APHY|nr:hypothetical protein NM688_g6529 [Phlebia brevispora]